MSEYPSNITQEQYEMIKEELEGARKRTKPRKVDLYDVFCGVLYVLRGGIQWRMMPENFPKWQLCYYYFRIWSYKGEEGKQESILEKVLKNYLSIHLTQLLVTSDLKRQIGAFTAASARRSKRVS